MLCTVTVFAAIYVLFILRTQKSALRASEYRLQAEKMRTRMLREQINPHFIFNSLTALKEAYHMNTERGDVAISLFSKHLRANVEAMNTELIPFEKELDNVEVYIGLENLKREKPLNILYNVERTDFQVPVLSLQVFVENAVKYSGIEKKEDGCIEIASRYEDGFFILEINDNGVGFDVQTVKADSCGIANAKKRFRLLMNAEVTVESTVGEGTCVTVRISVPPPVRNKEKQYEDYYC